MHYVGVKHKVYEVVSGIKDVSNEFTLLNSPILYETVIQRILHGKHKMCPSLLLFIILIFHIASQVVGIIVLIFQTPKVHYR